VLTTAAFITADQIPVNSTKPTTASDRQDATLIITITAGGGESFVNDRAVTISTDLSDQDYLIPS
jgi:hypothetical protein